MSFENEFDQVVPKPDQSPESLPDEAWDDED